MFVRIYYFVNREKRSNTFKFEASSKHFLERVLLTNLNFCPALPVIVQKSKKKKMKKSHQDF